MAFPTQQHECSTGFGRVIFWVFFETVLVCGSVCIRGKEGGRKAAGIAGILTLTPVAVIGNT